jgi:4-hydroxybenzoate polyprenyltransferase
MSRARTYAQLVRLPNVFTALADICLGTLAGRVFAGAQGADAPRSGAEGWLAPALLLAASACLYCGGMVWNDFFDLEQDRRERPFRPLPSGRVSRREASRLAAVLLAVGLGLAALAGFQAGGWKGTPVMLAGVLAAAILLYDGWLKRTWAGPVGMGACRFLNVLLGLSAAGGVGGSRGVYLAVIVGLYIVGVTWFARIEARTSSPPALAGAAGVMLLSLCLALPLPEQVPPGTSSPLFPYLLVGLGFLVGVPVCQAIARPVPAAVQAAVKRAILGLVVLDATLATALAGAAGLLILVLLLPALYVGRWIYST